MNEQHTPQPVKLISDLETLKVITDPLRMRILSLLSERPRTVKDVAQVLNMPTTRLYYHFSLLEKHGLIRVVSTRVVSGIIEKHYQVTAYEFNVDRKLLAPNAPTAGEGWRLVFSQTLDALQNDLTRLAEDGSLQALMEAEETQGEPVPMRISRALARLSRPQAQALVERLKDLVAEFENQPHSPDDAAEPYALFVAFYPAPKIPDTAEEPPVDTLPQEAEGSAEAAEDASA